MSNWQSVADLTGPALRLTTRGCPDCGSTTTHRTPTGQVVTYPSVECCTRALQRQITWRSNDIDQLKAHIKTQRATIDELRRQSDDAVSRQAKDSLEIQIGRAERHHITRMTDHYEPQLRELSNEIGRLNAKLLALTDAPTSRPQRLDLDSP